MELMGVGEEKTKMTQQSTQRKQKKKEVCGSILRQLAETGHEASKQLGFAQDLQAHFIRLPTRYALDVHIDRAEDVLTHKRLLEEAKIPEKMPAFHVRAVQVLPIDTQDGPGLVDEVDGLNPFSKPKLAPPAFGSSPNLEALAMDFNNNNKGSVDDDDDSHHSQRWKKFHACFCPTNSVSVFCFSSTCQAHLPMHEITFSTIDKPKLLSQMSTLLADVGLNIREAHVFSTMDGYSLDVFVVDGWHSEATHDLTQALNEALAAMEKGAWTKFPPASEGLLLPEPVLQAPIGDALEPVPSSTGTDDWEIDSSQLKFVQKVANGSFGDLYRGTYCGQDVAIKVLKPERLNDNLKREFQQEVFIMRKVRHKNIVQFIGACTKPPNLCIVTEYMSGGSVYDYLHKQKAVLKMPMLLRVAVDISKGMDYLHQNKIIHRDLKAANLLMDENEVVKVADFGVARVQAQSGIMTAETGTYRWMAPEVIEHKPYDCKADVFSFGIVLWELLSGQVPYADLTPLQAAVGVVQKGLRPTIPKNINPKLAELLLRCWKADPSERPDFSEITTVLQEILKEVNQDVDDENKRHKDKDKKLTGLFSTFKRSPAR